MAVYYFLFFILIGGNLFWLRRLGQPQNLLFTALIGLLPLTALGFVLALVWQQTWWVGGLQTVALLIWLWGHRVKKRIIAVGCLLLILLLWLFPFPLVELLTWGLLTAVPLSTFYLLRSRSAIPIFTPTMTQPQNRPLRIKGKLTPEIIESQLPLLECLRDGVVYNGQEGVVVYANQAAATILGLPAADITGLPASKILSRLPIVASASAMSPLNQFELNGRIIQGYLNIVYNTNGVAQGTVAILHDITAEYQAQRTRDGFLTTISHELRTPITAIKGYVELLNSGAGGSLNTPQKNFLAIIQRNINRLTQLINSLIFAAALKGGRMEFTPGYADLPQLIQQVVRETQPKAAETNITMKLNLENSLGQVHIDPNHLITILEELLSNAIKYNRPNGEIQINASLTTDEKNQQTFVIVSVGDTGIGIAPDDQTHVFEDFFRPDSLEAQVRAGGIGMGLSIVRALVEAYNGRIWFDSTPDKGTTFSFILPTGDPNPNPT